MGAVSGQWRVSNPMLLTICHCPSTQQPPFLGPTYFLIFFLTLVHFICYNYLLVYFQFVSTGLVSSVIFSIITLIVWYCWSVTISGRLLPAAAIPIFCTLFSHSYPYWMYDHQDEGTVVFWNVWSYWPIDFMSHPGRLESLAALLQGSQLLHCSYFFSLQGSRCVPERDCIVSRIGHQALCFISDVQILTKSWRWRKHYFCDGRDVRGLEL